MLLMLGGSRPSVLPKSLRDEKDRYFRSFARAVGTLAAPHRPTLASAHQASPHPFGWYGDTTIGRLRLLGMGQTQHTNNC